MLSTTVPGCPLHMLCIYVVTFLYQKGILGQGGKASKNKLKDTNSNVPMTKFVALSIFHPYAQKNDSTLFNLKRTCILNISALYTLKDSNTFTHSFVKTLP